jgi:hypothetical protein
MLECRVEQCEHGLPVAFGGSGIIDWRILEHPAVFRLIGLDPVIDAPEDSTHYGARRGIS